MANLKFYPGDTAMTRDGRRATVETSDGGVRGWPIRICLPKGGAMTARRSGRTSDLQEMPEDLVAIVERAKPTVLPQSPAPDAAQLSPINDKIECETIRRDLLKLRLDKEQGLTISRAAHRAALEEIGRRVARRIRNLTSFTQDLTTAVNEGNRPEVNDLLEKLAHDMEADISNGMSGTATPANDVAQLTPISEDNDRAGGADYRVRVREGYGQVAHILIDALDQMQSGKGNERHTEPQHHLDFADQDTPLATRMMGVGGPGLQIIKKMGEARRMYERGNIPAARHELLGIIGYAVIAIVEIDRNDIPL